MALRPSPINMPTAGRARKTPFQPTAAIQDTAPVGSTFTQKLAELKTQAPVLAGTPDRETVGLPGLESNIQQLTQQKAAISGRAPSQREVAGVVQGLAAGAQSRLERREEIDLKKQIHEEGLQASFDLQGNEIAAAEARQANDINASFANTQATLESAKDLQSQQIASAENIFQAGDASEMERFSAQFAESQRQFDANLNSQVDRFWATFAQSDEQFTAGLDQNARQFETQLSQEYDIFTQTMAEQVRVTNAEMAAAEQARQYEQTGGLERAFGDSGAPGMITSGLPLGGGAKGSGKVLDSVLDPFGLTKGGGGTWLCTAMRENTDIKAPEIETLRSYGFKKHRKVARWYLANGIEIVEAVSKQEDDLKTFYGQEGRIAIAPICANVREGEMEKAYQKYIAWVKRIAQLFTPHMLPEIETLLTEDAANG